MILFKNVTKKYKNHEDMSALDDVSFQIDDGEFVFLVGASGSGKSTIVRLLVREEVPSSGEIYFNDIEITKMKKSGLPILRREIGVVFQDYKLLPNKTVWENIAFTLEVSGKSAAEVNKTTDYIIDLVGLGHKKDDFPNQLSGGEAQRVAIARALVNDPQVLIADEPTGNLDPENAWDIIQLLNKVNNWGTTVIMATHDKEIVNSLSKRVIELDHGKIVRDEGSGKYDEKKKKKENKEEPVEQTENEEESKVKEEPEKIEVKLEVEEIKPDSKAHKIKSQNTKTESNDE